MNFVEWLSSFTPLTQATFATVFTWLMTALGAAMVFFFKDLNKKMLDIMLGAAAGIMIAASFWSLLSPAIDMQNAMGKIGWVPAVVGFLAGAVFLRLADRFIPHLHSRLSTKKAEGIPVKWNKNTLLVLAITLHNIPEGLAVGVIFGSLATGSAHTSITSAIALAIGIGIQNLPEGAAVSLPLLRNGQTKFKAFMVGQFSGIVEVAGGVIGAIAVTQMTNILPYALSFAAGAMIYVVVEELIPESQRGEHNDLATMGTIFGFTIMMFLDVALG